MLQSANAERIIALKTNLPPPPSAPTKRPRLVVANPLATSPKTSEEQYKTNTAKLPGRERLFVVIGLAAGLWLLIGIVVLLCASLL